MTKSTHDRTRCVRSHFLAMVTACTGLLVGAGCSSDDGKDDDGGPPTTAGSEDNPEVTRRPRPTKTCLLDFEWGVTKSGDTTKGFKMLAKTGGNYTADDIPVLFRFIKSEHADPITKMYIQIGHTDDAQCVRDAIFENMNLFSDLIDVNILKPPGEEGDHPIDVDFAKFSTTVENVHFKDTDSGLGLASAQVKSVSNLQDLTLGTDLSWTDGDLETLNGADLPTTITNLDLHNNQLTSLGNMNRLTNLDTLNLNGNQLTSFGNLKSTKLTNLQLNGQKLAEVRAENLPSTMTGLYLTNNPITLISGFANLPNLQELKIDCYYPESYDPPQECTKLSVSDLTDLVDAVPQNSKFSNIQLCGFQGIPYWCNYLYSGNKLGNGLGVTWTEINPDVVAADWLKCLQDPASHPAGKCSAN